MNEHIKCGQVAYMCYTALMTKKSRGSFKYSPKALYSLVSKFH